MDIKLAVTKKLMQSTSDEIVPFQLSELALAIKIRANSECWSSLSYSVVVVDINLNINEIFCNKQN